MDIKNLHYCKLDKKLLYIPRGYILHYNCWDFSQSIIDCMFFMAKVSGEPIKKIAMEYIFDSNVHECKWVFSVVTDNIPAGCRVSDLHAYEVLGLGR